MLAANVNAMALAEILTRLSMFALNNPLLTCLVMLWLYNQYQKSLPWPDVGGDVDTVDSPEKLAALQADDERPLLVLDCYALWCPPCKAAAPAYARMSEQYPAARFAKLNVDDAKSVARALEIAAMPTFLVFRGAAEIGRLQGWNETALRKLIEKHGAKRIEREPEAGAKPKAS